MKSQTWLSDWATTTTILEFTDCFLDGVVFNYKVDLRPSFSFIFPSPLAFPFGHFLLFLVYGKITFKMMILHVFSIFISAVNMLSIIILSFLYVKSNIRDISEFSSDSIFMSSDFFFFLFVMPCNFFFFFFFFWTAGHKCRHWDTYETYIYIYKIFAKAYLIYLCLDMCMPFFPETKIMGLCLIKLGAGN